jgi:hypothetical protein
MYKMIMLLAISSQINAGEPNSYRKVLESLSKRDSLAPIPLRGGGGGGNTNKRERPSSIITQNLDQRPIKTWCEWFMGLFSCKGTLCCGDRGKGGVIKCLTPPKLERQYSYHPGRKEISIFGE